VRTLALLHAARPSRPPSPLPAPRPHPPSFPTRRSSDLQHHPRPARRAHRHGRLRVTPARSAAHLPDLGAPCARRPPLTVRDNGRSEEHTSELQSRFDLVCRLLLEKKKKRRYSAQEGRIM